jgi:hypothetical protein
MGKGKDPNHIALQLYELRELEIGATDRTAGKLVETAAQ